MIGVPSPLGRILNELLLLIGTLEKFLLQR